MTGPELEQKKKKPILLIATVLLSLLGAIGFWMYSSRAKTAEAASETKPLIMVHLDPFVVNLADTGEKSYLRVGIDLGVELAGREKKSESTSESTPVIRDTIISVLSTRHGDELLTAEGKQKLKDDLIASLKARPVTSNVREIYFNEFLVQR
jgi:flagellar protein FliL